jgi:glycosyltransferase involved in cell wall biosynthesis
VLAQTYKDIEVIVVNDASTDGTEKYLRQKAQDESRLVYFTNLEPRGAPASRNLAIVHSKGDFVTGLDDDDEFHLERIGAFVDYWNLLKSRGTNPACLYSQDTWVRDRVPFLVSQKRSNLSADDLFETNYIGNQIFAPKSHYVEVGLFDEQLPAWQDLDMFIRILSRFGRGHLLDMPTYLIDRSPRSDRISATATKIRGAFEIVMNKYAADTPSDAQKLFLQIFSEYYGIRPSVFDWVRFFRWGFWVGGVWRLCHATFMKNKLG